MRHSVWPVIATVALCAMGCNANQTPPPGKQAVGPLPMPAFDYKDLSGKRWSAEQFRDKTTVIEFWATWCTPCREISPDLSAFYKRNRLKAQFLTVSLDGDLAPVKAFAKRHPDHPPIVFAGRSVAKTWDFKLIPTLVLVRNGHVLFSWTGTREIREALPVIERELL